MREGVDFTYETRMGRLMAGSAATQESNLGSVKGCNMDNYLIALACNDLKE